MTPRPLAPSVPRRARRQSDAWLRLFVVLAASLLLAGAALLVRAQP